MTKLRDLDLPVTDTAHGGKGINNFHQRKILASVKKGISLLDPGERRLLFYAGIVQLSLGLLDLLGIALIGLVAAVAVSRVGATHILAPIEDLLDTVHLENLTVSQIPVILALSAVTIWIVKTGLSALMARKIMFFLANQQAELSVKLARNCLSSALVVIKKWTKSEATCALGVGASAATFSLLGAGITIASEVFLFLIVGLSLLFFDPVLTIVTFALFSPLFSYRNGHSGDGQPETRKP